MGVPACVGPSGVPASNALLGALQGAGLCNGLRKEAVNSPHKGVQGGGRKGAAARSELRNGTL